jgi:hypothetical protein
VRLHDEAAPRARGADTGGSNHPRGGSIGTSVRLRVGLARSSGTRRDETGREGKGGASEGGDGKEEGRGWRER